MNCYQAPSKRLNHMEPLVLQEYYRPRPIVHPRQNIGMNTTEAPIIYCPAL